MNTLLLTLSLCLLGQPRPVEAPKFHITSAERGSVVGSISKLEENLAIEFAEKEAPLPSGDLLSLQRIGLPRGPFPDGEQVVLANGDRWPGKLLSGDELALKLEVPINKSKSEVLALPLSAMAVLWLIPPTGDAAKPDWHPRDLKQDTLRLKNGETIRGNLERISENGDSLRFKPAGQMAKTYERSTIAALALDTSLTRVRLPKTAYSKLVLTNGMRLSAKSVSIADTKVSAVLMHGAKLTFPLNELVALDVFQGKATYLSDMKPAAVKEEAFNGLVWPHKLDQSAKGHPLRLTSTNGTEQFEKGVGMHSHTKLTYNLGGKYKRLEAQLGLDAISGQRGNADVRILVDGKEAFMEKTLKHAAGIKLIFLDVTKAKELVLIVDYGEGGDVQDDVNWANARLVE